MKKWFCLLAIFIMIFVTGCADDTLPKNEYGFVNSGSGDPDITYRCAYKLPQTEFNKSNVTIETFYGNFSGGCVATGAVIRVFLVIDEPSRPMLEWDKDAYFIREISGDEFMSDKYYCYGTKNEKGESRWVFNHHETIKIPEKIFDRQKGSISFGIMEYFEDSQTYGSGKSINVNFSMTEDTVVLSIPNK